MIKVPNLLIVSFVAVVNLKSKIDYLLPNNKYVLSMLHDHFMIVG